MGNSAYNVVIDENPDLTLREFAMRCARRIDLFSSQRDEPMESLPRKQVLDQSHAEDLLNAAIELRDLLGKGRSMIQQEYDKEASATDAYNRDALLKHEEHNRRFGLMLAKVEEWEVSPELGPLKKFMLEQILLSYKPDEKPHQRYKYPSPEKKHEANAEVCMERIARLLRTIKDEMKAVEDRNSFLASLERSLAQAELLNLSGIK